MYTILLHKALCVSNIREVKLSGNLKETSLILCLMKHAIIMKFCGPIQVIKYCHIIIYISSIVKYCNLINSYWQDLNNVEMRVLSARTNKKMGSEYNLVQLNLKWYKNIIAPNRSLIILFFSNISNLADDNGNTKVFSTQISY